MYIYTRIARLNGLDLTIWYCIEAVRCDISLHFIRITDIHAGGIVGLR